MNSTVKVILWILMVMFVYILFTLLRDLVSLKSDYKGTVLQTRDGMEKAPPKEVYFGGKNYKIKGPDGKEYYVRPSNVANLKEIFGDQLIEEKKKK